MANKSKFNRSKRNDTAKSKRGKAGSNRSCRSVDSRNADTEVNKPINDFAWYNRNPRIIVDSANFPYHAATGTKFEVVPSEWQRAENPTAVPGIMTLDFVPFPGVSDNAHSAINVAATGMYSFVRHKNSGHTNYEHSDMMMYYLAMDSIYTMYAYMVRVYGTAQLYAAQNRYLPRGLMATMGFKLEEVQSNLARLRGFINMYALRINTLCVPADTTVVPRHVWMAANIFMDDPTPKGQFYMYRPTTLWKYSGYTDEHGGEMIPKHFPTEWRNLDEMFEFANDLLLSIYGDEDINIISGDILKAYGEGNLYQVSQIDEGFVVVPSVSAEVALQILNAESYRLIWSVDDENGEPQSSVFIKQGGGVIQSGALVSYYPMGVKHLLNMPAAEVNPEMNTIATRMKLALGRKYEYPEGADQVEDLDAAYWVESSGTELPTACRVWHYQWEPGAHIASILFGRAFYTHLFGTYINSNSVTSILNLLSAFHVRPAVFTFKEWDIASGVHPEFDGLNAPLANYALLDESDISNVHEAVLTNMWNIPSIARE